MQDGPCPVKCLRYISTTLEESSKSLLEAKGIINRKDADVASADLLKVRNCPNCLEPNKPDSRFCSRCKMVLMYSSYQDTLEEQKRKEDRINSLEMEMQLIKQGQFELMTLFKDPEKLNSQKLNIL